ncbi:UNVERIFIED_CONTAM: hypothetical protein FKN15_056345 [Acipenser sinensis]
MQSSFLSAWHLCFMVAMLAGSCCCQTLKPTRYPIFTHKPFLLAWNAPTQNCEPQYGVTLNLAVFDLVASPNEGLVGQKLTIFYKTRLGLYPYYTNEGVAVNGGIPQLAILRDHLAKMPEWMDRYIPEHRSEGLAVIDWEEWRPQWARNWDAKDIYRNASCGVVQGAMQGMLGSYLLNVSTAAQLCSGSRCNLNGRCVRLNPNTNTYLHLNARSFQITQEEGSLKVKGELSSADRDDFRRYFICQCYSGYSGDSCAVPNAACSLRSAVSNLLAVTFLLGTLPSSICGDTTNIISYNLHHYLQSTPRFTTTTMTHNQQHKRMKRGLGPPAVGGVEDGGVSTKEEEKKPMCDAEVTVVPLHRRPDLVGACADLVNSEWQRSRAARIHSLEKSCDGFPVCLVLVSRADQLLGHARLSLVVGQPRSLFVETVVVSRELRGKGYGRRLMEATERYARSRGFWRLCLTTHDKQHFYAHLGFVLSEPVQNAGSMTTFMPMEVLQRFSRPPATSGEGDKSGLNQTSSPPPQSPPLAPFLNPPLSQAPPLALFQLMPTLSAPPPPLAPPPPSPANHLPPPPSGLKTLGSKDPPGQTLLETPYRDLKGQPIYWMKKEL